MIPTWMVVDKVVNEMESLRKAGVEVRGKADVELALSDADTSVRSLTLASDADAVHRAWRAVSRAESAVSDAIRAAAPRRRVR